MTENLLDYGDNLDEPMRAEAAHAGFYSSPGWNSKHPRLQLLTVSEILAGKGIDYPHQTASTCKKAPRHEPEVGELPYALI